MALFWETANPGLSRLANTARQAITAHAVTVYIHHFLLINLHINKC